MHPTTTTYPRKNGARTPGAAPALESDTSAGRYELQAKMDAVNRSQAMIEYKMDGTVITANENFLKIFGYRLEEIQGQPASVLADAADRDSEEFRQLWRDIEDGKPRQATSKRVGKGGKQVWLEASYNPICDHSGKPYKIVVFAIDVTNTKLKNADYQGQIAAINKAQAVIEFKLDGTIITANENFLKIVGYRLDEVQGQHTGMFVDPVSRATDEYQQFWRDLQEGRYHTAESKRLAKGGKEVWIEASYNPIFDLNGKPYKIVEIATDVSTRKAAEITLRKTMGIVAQNSQTLSSASEELAANSQQMVSNAEETATQAGVVSAAAEQVSKNVQTVATGTEEMSASIKEIAKNAQDAAKVAAVAVKAAETTNATVVKLGESSAEIGKVIKVITSIAQQTNLLALNATIEAARAGEAGKGFAVVANEVKELAKETAKATEDIGQKIEAIQTATKSAVQAIGEISGTINKISDYQTTIASAVEEQTVTTNEIARNVAEAAKGSSEIAQNIAGVATAAKSTTSGANDTKKASAELSRMAAELQAIVTASEK